jgi:putative tryptophan/tyrosine transport system substrate-binding protein
MLTALSARADPGAIVSRRAFLTYGAGLGLSGAGLGLLASGCGSLLAQRPTRMPRIGMLTQGGFVAGGLITSIEDDYFVEGFRQGLHDYGWVEGQNIAVEYRFFEQNEQTVELAAELVNSGVDLIFVTSTPAAFAAKQASTTLPIVFGLVSDPVGVGLVTSLARPGGNLTGLSFYGPASVVSRRLQLLKELVPTISRVADLSNPTSSGNQVAIAGLRDAAPALGIQLVEVPVQATQELNGALQFVISSGADALYISLDNVFNTQLMRILDFAVMHGLPTASAGLPSVAKGVFMAYGPDEVQVLRRGGYYVDRILRGARPADLPVEQPTELHLAVNRHTAELLQLTIPPETASQVTRWVD